MSNARNPSSADLLLQTCRASADDESVTVEWLADLRSVATLVVVGRGSDQHALEHALTLLAGCLGQLRQWNPTHLPFGFGGPTIRSHSWMDRDDLEQVAKQLVGLIWDDVAQDVIADRVPVSVSEAIRLGFMVQEQYDAWRPGMPSGSGWRNAVAVTPLGMARARSCLDRTPRHEARSSLTAVPAGGCSPNFSGPADGWAFRRSDDGEVRATNQKLCSDYAALDEHDLLAISERWRRMAREFTEVTKRTGHYHGHITHADDVLRMTKILETAVSHHGIEGVSRLGRCLRRPDDDHLHGALATLDEFDAKLRAESVTKNAMEPAADVAAQAADRYNWASQVEVSRAVCSVLGEDAAPDKATISRAVQRGLIESNGKSGRACLVNVESLKSWIAKWAKIDTFEAHQVVIAVIAEINSRKG